MKLPSFQFYPGDWRKDPGIQSLTFEERGVWFEMLLIMHESDPRGTLTLCGSPYPIDRLARLLGLSVDYVQVMITAFLSTGVASRCEQTGALICRRMVKDEKARLSNSAKGSKGGNPNFKKGVANPYYNKPNDNPKDKLVDNLDDKPKITSSSSSSSSSSDINTEPLLLETESETNAPPYEPLRVRICCWFDRRINTPWSDKELKKLEEVRLLSTEAEISVLEEFYKFCHDPKWDSRKRNVITLLNNWQSEIDKAKGWKRRQNVPTQNPQFSPPTPKKHWEMTKEEILREAL